MRHISARQLLTVLLLIAIAAVLSACSTTGISRQLDPVSKASSTMVPGVETLVPQAEEELPLLAQNTAMLYYRYQNEAYLAPQSRTISRMASQTWEYAVVNQLLQGPGPSSGLTALFPPDTRLLSAVKQGRTLFVTLSAEVLSAYPDEPADWQQNETWRRESPLRRRLCMQSLVATVTENCEVDQVQVLVQQSGSNVGSLRLKQSYFLDDTPDSVLVGPMTRDASLLLGPDASMAMILRDWSARDWQSLHRWLLARDPATGESRPTDRDFVTLMDAIPALVSYDISQATISRDGRCATFAITMRVLRQDGSTEELPGRIVRLYSDGSCWLTTAAQLRGWTEVEE